MLRRLRSIAQCTAIALTYAIEAAGAGGRGGVMVSVFLYVLLVRYCWSVVGCWLWVGVFVTKVRLGTYHSTH